MKYVRSLCQPVRYESTTTSSYLKRLCALLTTTGNRPVLGKAEFLRALQNLTVLIGFYLFLQN